MQNCFIQNNGTRRLAEALVFAHGDRAGDEARRNLALNEISGNQKLAAEWARALELVSVPKFQHAA